MELFQDKYLRASNTSHVIRCPKCQSVYVDNNECESCGLQIGLDRLGDPLGARSYYAIIDRYNRDHKILGINLFYLMKSKRKEKRLMLQLRFRFDILLDYFLSEKDSNHYRRKVFWAELKTLIWEMIKRGEPYNKIADKVESHPGHTEYRLISSEIINYLIDCGQNLLSADLLSKILNYKIYNSIRVLPFSLFIAITSLVIFSSLSLYQYFLLSI